MRKALLCVPMSVWAIALILVYAVDWDRPTGSKWELDRWTADTIKDASKADHGTFVIHRSGYRCPNGWGSVPDYFREENGTREDACILIISSDGTQYFDYLKTGEGGTMRIEIPLGIRIPKRGL